MCWHKWKIKDKEILTSGMEQLHAAGLRKIDGVPYDLFEKPCIVTYECQKCGEEKVERI